MLMLLVAGGMLQWLAALHLRRRQAPLAWIAIRALGSFQKRPGRFLALPEASEGASGRPGRRRLLFFHVPEVSGDEEEVPGTYWGRDWLQTDLFLFSEPCSFSWHL
jgi:hypothetical protein